MICIQLKEMREKLGWSYQELADKSGVPIATVKRVMTQHTYSPTWQTVCSLVSAMGGSMDELAGIPVRRASENDNELVTQSLAAAQEAIQLCHKGLAEKNAELEQARSDLDKTQKAYLEMAKKVEKLQATLSEKELRLDGHASLIRSKNKWLTRLSAVALILMVVLVVVLLVDYMIPSIGYLRR